MIILSSMTDKIQLTRSSVADIDYVVNYVIADVTSSPMVVKGADNKSGTFNTAATDDVSGSPTAANDRWSITGMEFRNVHASTSNDLTLEHVKAGGTARDLIKVTLAAGEKLTYSSHGVWFVYAADGGVKMGGTAATEDDVGLIAIATSGEQAVATNIVKAVTPGRQEYHPSSVKFWLKAGLTGNILDSWNVTSLTDTGTGALTITIAADFTEVHWACIATIELASTTVAQSCTYDSMSNGTVILRSVVEAGSAADPVTWSCAGIGDR